MTRPSLLWDAENLFYDENNDSYYNTQFGFILMPKPVACGAVYIFLLGIIILTFITIMFASIITT